MGVHQVNAAEDDDFLQKLIQSKAKDGFMSKKDAQEAAITCVERWNGLKGEENKQYMAENFEEAWENHDV